MNVNVKFANMYRLHWWSRKTFLSCFHAGIGTMVLCMFQKSCYFVINLTIFVLKTRWFYRPFKVAYSTPSKYGLFLRSSPPKVPKLVHFVPKAEQCCHRNCHVCRILFHEFDGQSLCLIMLSHFIEMTRFFRVLLNKSRTKTTDHGLFEMQLEAGNQFENWHFLCKSMVTGRHDFLQRLGRSKFLARDRWN